MPDWTYRTLLQPVLFRCPIRPARLGALKALARLARFPGGPRLIEFFGHMRIDPRLVTRLRGIEFPSAVGIGAGLDPDGIALRALARFGVGFVEVGPVGTPRKSRTERLYSGKEILVSEGAVVDREDLAETLDRWGRIPVPVWIRLAAGEAAGWPSSVRRLLPYAMGFVVEMEDVDDSETDLVATVRAAQRRPVWLGIAAQLSESEVEQRWRAAARVGVSGIWFLAEQIRPNGARIQSHKNFPAVLHHVRHFRTTFGPEPGVAAGGAHSPAEAMELRRAGANLLSLDLGLVFTGPGLPKRVNAALLHQVAETSNAEPDIEAPARSWWWFFLLGIGMLGGGCLALIIASTRVVLPYDEVFCGMNRDQLAALNPRLLAFMAHDRVTLAGTMISAGVLYAGIAGFGVRRGLHWAKVAIAVSATSGFFSFFLFLGFGYFDPFHAFVTAILFQFLLLGLHAPLGPIARKSYPELTNSPAWRRGQWGQLLMVGLGLGLIAAGLVICGVGITRVFVPEDLDFLRTTAGALQAANPRLVPLVAHDRASLGGMLMACGLVTWLTAQWGFRAGERWLWWTLLLGGMPAFGAAIGVHLIVGYLSFEHLAPAFFGLLWFGLALALSHGWLTQPESIRREDWRSLE